NCETDFVTKNDTFQELVSDLATHLVKEKPANLDEALQQTVAAKGQTVEEYINSVIATIGEKITLRRFEILEKEDNETFGSYLHMGGRIGTITLLADTDNEEVAQNVAMHVAAVNPRYISRDDVPQEEVDRERAVLKEQALNEGKPEHIVEKMVEGRLGKFYEEICLL